MNFNEWKHLLLILVIFTAACIETDIYLPAFTDMMVYFSVSEDTIQSLLTWNFAGMCLVGPIYGPISDAVGRRKPLLCALGLFFVGSILTCIAPTFDLMLAGRILQGLGSGGCFALGTAVIFDTFNKERAMYAINKMNTIIPFIMAGAPILGGYLNQMYGFRSNFLVIVLCVLASLLITFLFFKESHPKEKRNKLELSKIAAEFRTVGSSLAFWQLTCVISLVFAGYLTFLSGISVLYVLEMGVSKENLPYFQLALLGAWLSGNLLYHRVVRIFGLKKIKRAGTILMVSGGVILGLSAWLIPTDPYLPTFAMILYCFGVNWINSYYFPETMELFPNSKGTAASLISSARLLLTAAVVGFSGMIYDGTIIPLACVDVTLICVISYLLYSYERKRGDRPDVDLSEPVIEII